MGINQSRWASARPGWAEAPLGHGPAWGVGLARWAAYLMMKRGWPYSTGAPLWARMAATIPA
jgi:hypothetical protein